MSFRDIPDHPVIANMERAGCPDGREPTPPRCPVCDGECELIFRRKDDLEIIGCDLCVEDIGPWDI